MLRSARLLHLNGSAKWAYPKTGWGTRELGRGGGRDLGGLWRAEAISWLKETLILVFLAVTMIEYILDKAQRLVKIPVCGSDISYEHFLELWKRMDTDPNYDPTFNHLTVIDKDAAGPLVGEMPMMKSMLEMMAQRQTTAKKWAIVVPSLWKRTMAEILFESVNLGRVQMRFFADEVEAMTWINTDSANKVSTLT